jgi:hypothetical protein
MLSTLLQTEFRWPAVPTTVTVAFMDASGPDYPMAGFSPFTAAERAAAVSAIEYVGSVSGIKVQLLADGANADIEIGWATLNQNEWGVTHLDETTQQSEIFLSAGMRGGLQIGPDLMGTRILIHELGHAVFRLADMPGDGVSNPPATHLDYNWLDSTKFTLGDRMVITNAYGAPTPGAAWFDAEWYVAKYADVRAAVQAGYLTAQDHWNAYGWAEGRDPSAFFDASEYLDDNPDVAAAHVNPLNHYLQYGQYEDRAPIIAAGWDGIF